jgi:DNA-binding CsgD family transcriptional regulator
MRRASRVPILVSLKVAHSEPPAIQRPREVEHGATERGLQLMADRGRHPGASAIETMGEINGLTPGEVRVLHAVLEVGGIREIAAALAISPTTVKTHLRHIFQKTGAKGQVDLIRLVARAAGGPER